MINFLYTYILKMVIDDIVTSILQDFENWILEYLIKFSGHLHNIIKYQISNSLEYFIRRYFCIFIIVFTQGSQLRMKHFSLSLQ